MKVAYVFSTTMSAVYKLGTMILPQLEEGRHGVTVVGMFLFDDNVFLLRSGDTVGERLAKVAAANGILVMACDQCAVRRGLADGPLDRCGTGEIAPRGLVAGATVGCFPQLYAALGGNPPDHVITL